MQKEDIIVQIKQSQKDLHEWYENRSEELFDKKVIQGKWSSKEHLLHLIISNLSIRKGLQMRKEMLLQTFGKLDRKELNETDLYAKYKTVLTAGAKAPPNMQPMKFQELNKMQLLDFLRSETEKMLGHLSNWSEENLSELVLPHPILKNLSLREMAMFNYMHNYHHLRNLQENY